MSERLRDLVKGIAKAMRADADVDYSFGYPSLVNDPAMTELFRGVAVDLVGAENLSEVDPVLGGEDMSYFLQRAPGCFFRLGTGNKRRGITFGNHHPRFDVDESALPLGVAAMTTTALRFLGGK
jgi:amidohydrolase